MMVAGRETHVLRIPHQRILPNDRGGGEDPLPNALEVDSLQPLEVPSEEEVELARLAEIRTEFEDASTRTQCGLSETPI